MSIGDNRQTFDDCSNRSRDAYSRFSAAAFGEANISRLYPDVHRIANARDSDYDAQNPGSVFAHERNTCASSKLWNFPALDIGGRVALSSLERRAAKSLRAVVWCGSGADIR